MQWADGYTDKNKTIFKTEWHIQDETDLQCLERSYPLYR